MADRPTRTVPHAEHDALLIVAWASGDADERDGARAAALAETCAECGALAADVTAIRAATRALPAPRRPRDFRLAPGDAERLRGRSGWLGRLAERFGGGSVGVMRPLAAAMTAIGLAGLLFSALPTTPASGPAARTEEAETLQSPAFGGGAAPAAASGPAQGPTLHVVLGASGAPPAEPAASAANGDGFAPGGAELDALQSGGPEIAGEPSAAARDTASGGMAGAESSGSDGAPGTTAAAAPLSQASDAPAGDDEDAPDPALALPPSPAASDALRPAVAVGSAALLVGGLVLLVLTRSRGRPAG